MEMRKHYFLDKFVIIANERSKRPHQFYHKKEENKEDIDYFAPGNEHLTPDESYRYPENSTGKDWQIRVFPNKFAFLDPDAEKGIDSSENNFIHSKGYGYHEVLVETPDINKNLSDLKHDELKLVFRTYSKRIKELSSRQGISYVLVFKNSGKDAGTSIRHTHSQIAALEIVPESVKLKEDAIKKYGKDPFEDIIEKEKDSERLCFENNTMMAIAPYASRFPFEVLVVPKTFKKNIIDFEENELDDLTEIMSKLLKKLNDLNASYNFYLHYGIEKMRFHIEIAPRLGKWGGFEIGSGIIVNSVLPKDAAKFYRE
ncbi:MAG: galactose-1-phosphate uridylyltransferase [Candidatus Woesearchaeota archaeon]